MSDLAPAEHPADKRCFLALLPDAAGVRTLLRCRETLGHSLDSATRGVRWVEPTALHLTLRFLGESTGAQVEYLKHMLPTLAGSLSDLGGRDENPAARGQISDDVSAQGSTGRQNGGNMDRTDGFAGRPTQARQAPGTLPAIPSRRFCIWPNRSRPRLLVLELDASQTLLELVEGCEKHARKAGFAAETRDFRTHFTLARLRPGCVFGNLPSPPPAITFDAIALMQSTLSQPAAVYRELARVSLEAPSRL